MAEGVGFEPTDRVNGRRFSRPLHAFQTRQKQTNQNQERPTAAGGRVTVGDADSGRQATAGRVGAANPGTGQSGSAGWVRGEDGAAVRKGDDFYAGKDGNVYQRNDQGDWNQVERSGQRQGVQGRIPRRRPQALRASQRHPKPLSSGPRTLSPSCSIGRKWRRGRRGDAVKPTPDVEEPLVGSLERGQAPALQLECHNT